MFSNNDGRLKENFRIIYFKYFVISDFVLFIFVILLRIKSVIKVIIIIMIIIMLIVFYWVFIVC